MMVSSNAFHRVLTRIILPIAALYILSAGLDVTEADIEHSVDKPTLLSRTTPFVPGVRLLFKREANGEHNGDDDNDDGDDADNTDTNETTKSAATGVGGSKGDESVSSEAKEAASDSNEDGSDEDDASEGSRIDLGSNQGEMKLKPPNAKPVDANETPTTSPPGKQHPPASMWMYPDQSPSAPAKKSNHRPPSLSTSTSTTKSPAIKSPETDPNATTPKMSTTMAPGIKTTTTSKPRSSTTARPASSLAPATKLPLTSAAPATQTTRKASEPQVISSTVKPNGEEVSITAQPKIGPTTRLPTKPATSSSTIKSTSKVTPRPTKIVPLQSSTIKPTPKVTATTLPTESTITLPTLAPLLQPTQAAENSDLAREEVDATDSQAEMLLEPERPVVYVSKNSMSAEPPGYEVINGTTYVVADRPSPIFVNPNITRELANPDAELLLDFNRTIFEPRDVAYFLESHPAHSIHDPRVYFTSERTTRSMVILSRELQRVPARLRFAYMVRVFNELGRKIASKLNYYTVELVAVLQKSPDELGNKPEVSALVDAVNSAFESKDDGEIRGQAEVDLEFDNYMKRVVESSSEKVLIFRAAMREISNRFAQLISYFVLKSTTTTTTTTTTGRPPIEIAAGGHRKLALLLGESLRSGAKTFILETAYDDRFRIPLDAIGYTNLILNDTITMMTQRLKEKNMNVSESIRRDFDDSMNVNSFENLNPISDKIGLIGSWNSFLFSNLGTAERLMKVFGSLLGRVPHEIKARWINMYISQIHQELERTISAFVVMQGMPFLRNASETYLLDPNKTIELIPNKVPTIRDNYLADKNRIPARCYLAGRRWRLVLSRGLDKFVDKDFVLDSLANRVGFIKNRMIDQSGNDIFRLCLPRLEVGIRGWSIDGLPNGAVENSDKFPLKNPIEGLTEMRDPFASGVSLGFGIGVKVGYNEERNATLEMEQASHLALGLNDFSGSLGVNEMKYVSMASYRRAATIGSRKAFEISVREGYLTSLKVSVRAGMNIPVELGSRVSALKSVSFAGQAGQEAGKATAEAFISERKLPDSLKRKLVKVGQTFGFVAGEIVGESIGSIVGKAAAEEAYRRSIIRGGKVTRAKFHLEEFEAGAKLGFEYGVKEGKRIASSSTLDPSAPRFFRLPKPVFSSEDKPDNEVDHWEKELIPPLTDTIIADLASVRDHTPVRGALAGTYKIAKEVKKGFKRVSYSNVTYNLEVSAVGFIKDNIAYLTLNGTVNKMGILKGSLIARDIFNAEEDE